SDRCCDRAADPCPTTQGRARRGRAPRRNGPGRRSAVSTGRRLMSPKKERSFEESLARLESIVAELEGEDRGLEKQFALFQEGMELARFCDARLAEVEKSVEIVLKESAEGRK